MPQLTVKKTKKVYCPNDPSKGWVIIVYLKKGVRKSIQDDSNRIVGTDTGTGDMVTTMEFDLAKQRTLFLDAVTEEWGNFFDADGKEIPLNAFYLRAQVAEDSTFYDWLQTESDTFIKEVEAEEEPAREN